MYLFLWMLMQIVFSFMRNQNVCQVIFTCVPSAMALIVIAVSFLRLLQLCQVVQHRSKMKLLDHIKFCWSQGWYLNLCWSDMQNFWCNEFWSMSVKYALSQYFPFFYARDMISSQLFMKHPKAVMVNYLVSNNQRLSIPSRLGVRCLAKCKTIVAGYSVLVYKLEEHCEN